MQNNKKRKSKHKQHGARRNAVRVAPGRRRRAEPWPERAERTVPSATVAVKVKYLKTFLTLMYPSH